MNPQIINYMNISFLKNYINLHKKPIIKSKIKGTKNTTGRESGNGKIFSYHKGGGHKKNYRKIYFNRSYETIGIVSTIEYDPNRTSNIAAIYNFINKNYFYILATKNLQIGDIIKSGINAELKLGHSLSLDKIPIGSLISNISLKIKGQGQVARSAGTFAKLIEKNSYFSLIKMVSGKLKILPIKCFATLGMISNELHSLIQISKAGKSRWLNRRPKVRGVAMNPVDHPHGGGEGKKSGLKLSPWSKTTKKISLKKKTNGKIKMERSIF
jgi:large subunit ribosomal protein L2